jgi:hypothetical protein
MRTHSRVAPSLEDLRSGVRLLRDLPGYLRHPLSVEEARTVLRRRLERREADFLALLRRIFRSGPADPYRQLLALAACEEEDLAALTRKEGIEQTLRTLYRHGVYLTADEFKGRRPVVRGGRTVAMEPGRIRNPGTTAHVPILSSGSRGGRTLVPLDLAFLRECSVDLCLAMDARGGVAWRKGHWHVPGGAIVARLLEYAASVPFPSVGSRRSTSPEAGCRLAIGGAPTCCAWEAGSPDGACPPRSTSPSRTRSRSRGGCTTRCDPAPHPTS